MKNTIVIILIVLLVSFGCTPSSPTSKIPKTVGIIAIGHSGLTGESSNPDKPRQDARENSWATGTNPAVNSVYMRLITAHPETDGHVANKARGGAVVDELAGQARTALEKVPNPELVLIQTIDNDIRCDGTDPANIKAFGVSLSAALQVIVNASPESHILIISQPDRPQEFAAAMAKDPKAKNRLMGSGMCDMYDSNGNLNQQHVDTLTAIIEGYEAEQTRVCDEIPQCSTDGGATKSYVDDISNLVPIGGWDHLSVEGHARLAEIVWQVVVDILGLK